nr:uncharacterized protein CI109_001131 [Kwoniella shandongensis]KAA5530330.1 hypothetical protein CI109_001131 [Kwoniella shandongensis]
MRSYTPPLPLTLSSQTNPIRVNIPSLILKRGSKLLPPPSPSPSPPPPQPVSIPKTYQIVEETTHPEQVKEKVSADPFVILGPQVGQYMELSSSEGSSGTTRTKAPPSSPMKHHETERRSFSCYNLPPSPIHPLVRMERPLISSPKSEPIDWVEYSTHVKELEGWDKIEGDSQWSHSNISDGSTFDDPIIVTPSGPQASKASAVTLQDVIAMLNTPRIAVTLPTPPPSPPRFGKAMKSPELSTIESMSSEQSSVCNPNAESAHQPAEDNNVSGRPLILNTPLPVERLDQGQTNLQTFSQADPRCCACGRVDDMATAKRLIPCGDITCSSCFSSSLSAVSVTGGHSKCPKCFNQVITFQNLSPTPIHTRFDPRPSSTLSKLHSYPIPVARKEGESVVMRIDNVAWDLTPGQVESFLPPNTLSKCVPVPVHILLDRFDGKTRDYMYIEADSREAAQLILQTRQNTFMPGGPLTGGKKRPVTILMVSYEELVMELRPRSSQELHSLLGLCQAAISPIPNSTARFVKSRHGPFYALLSIMSKLSGKQSPTYWDLFHVASGAISTLSNAILSAQHDQPLFYSPTTDYLPANYEESDETMRDKLMIMFERCFGLAKKIAV